MRSKFLLTWRWLDIDGGGLVYEGGLEDAEEAMKQMLKQEKDRQAWDASAVGQLEVTIERWNFDATEEVTSW